MRGAHSEIGLGGSIVMRMVFAAVIALCSFLHPQTNIAVAQEAPAWLPGEYQATATLMSPNGPVTFFVQIKSVTVEADGRLALDIQARTDRDVRDWTPVRSYEAKLASPERVNIAFTTQRGSKFDLVAGPDGSLSGTVVPSSVARLEPFEFKKRK
jgi:hypothetical protein